MGIIYYNQKLCFRAGMRSRDVFQSAIRSTESSRLDSTKPETRLFEPSRADSTRPLINQTETNHGPNSSLYVPRVSKGCVSLFKAKL